MSNYGPDCKYTKRLLDKLYSLPNANLDFEKIKIAISFAKKHHDGQMRKSGEPFYSHPLEVAYMVSDHLAKTNVIIASILHDVVEDTDATVGMIVDKFGFHVATIVDMLTRDRPDGTKLSVEEIIYQAVTHNDYPDLQREVLLIKLFDRIHNMQTIKHLSMQKRQEIKDETIKIFGIICLLLDDFAFDELLKKSLDIQGFTTPFKELLPKNLTLFNPTLGRS